MRQLLYLEIPTRDLDAVQQWLSQQTGADLRVNGLQPPQPRLRSTADGLCLEWRDVMLTVVLWPMLNTTYLKIFQWSEQALPQQKTWLRQFEQSIRHAFPYRSTPFPDIDLEQSDIFSALAPDYPLTVKFFQRMPQGETDLQRVYWWEKRWRQEVAAAHATQKATRSVNPPILNQAPAIAGPDSVWDIIVVGGALGVLYAAMMARLGYKVALIERIKFGRMNREWNISRHELQTLVEVGLLQQGELESLIAREYQDNFNQFYQANNPANAKAPVLHTPTVLNIAMECDHLLQMCGEKLVAAGGTIFELTEFEQAFLEAGQVTVRVRHRDSQQVMHLQSRLLIDAMGTTSAIAQQMNPHRAFDSVCPTIGGVIKQGFAPAVWDAHYGEPLLTNGDISRGRQLIWELFPGAEGDFTIYLFHYHQIQADHPGSLLELYEDFFTCLPEYRRCSMEDLEWRKATFGYIPGRFSQDAGDRRPGYDRILSIGDAASLNSPLVFTGFGSLVRNLPRMAHLLHVALQYDLLSGQDLGQVNAYQDNLAVTWIFSRGMMAKGNSSLPPYWINATLNTFFDVLQTESTQDVDNFIKDCGTWSFMTRTGLKAGWQNPNIMGWVVQSIGFKELLKWIRTYLAFTLRALMAFFFAHWLPSLLMRWQTAIAAWSPRWWFKLLAWSYLLTYGMGNPQLIFRLPATIANLSTIPNTIDSQIRSRV